VDYGFVEARTTYGVLGVKVWIYKGEIFNLHQPASEEASNQQAQG
jgi:small subunit ribosomal protein S3